ncbi:MAG: Crp/Fnr family transcriptional regulator [Clostridiales Family XIII bacterium]|jgi:CRP-like cAMP-binding protein|nr:Crp/Fnr family transcriptional regulator [Clostridiales Family XIII bacterium]
MKAGGVFYGLTQEEHELARSGACGKSRSLEAGEFLVREGDAKGCFYLVDSGGFKGTRQNLDGDVAMMEHFFEGETVGLDIVFTRSRRFPYDVQATRTSVVTPVDALAFTDGRLPEGLRGKLWQNILHELANESVRKLYKIDVLYRRSLRARIAVFLRHMHERAEGTGFNIGMSREEFAQYLGVNRSALSHELSLMKQDGLIEFRRAEFRVADLGRLKAYID